MPAVPHFSLDTLPARFRAQVMTELGIGKVSAIPTIASGSEKDCGKGKGKGEGRIGVGMGGEVLGGGESDKKIGNHKGKPKRKNGKKHRHHSSPVRMASADGVGGGDAETGANSTEASFNAEVLQGRGRYEPLTLHLFGGNYTPDYLTVESHRNISTTGSACSSSPPLIVVLYEVKGSYRLPTHGRSVFAFKQACAEYPCFVFVFAEKAKGKGGEWNVGVYKGGRTVASFFGTPSEVRDGLGRTFAELLHPQSTDQYQSTLQPQSEGELK